MKLSISGILEKDLDLLFLQQFLSSAMFLKWFLNRIAFYEAYDSLVIELKAGARREKGESDLEVLLENQISGTQYLLLIENKINAGLQPNQAKRYSDYGKSLINRQTISDFKTVIIAPESYFTDSETKGFDSRLTYEEIQEWFVHEASDYGLKIYFTYLIESAIEKARLGYQRTEDKAATDFWLKYYNLLQKTQGKDCPIRMNKPQGVPSGSTFISLYSNELPKQCPIFQEGIGIQHKMGHGCVDLEFRNMRNRVNELEDRFRDCLPEGFDIKPLQGKAAAVRVKVPPMSMSDGFSPEKVTEVFRATSNLIRWYKSQISQTVLKD